MTSNWEQNPRHAVEGRSRTRRLLTRSKHAAKRFWYLLASVPLLIGGLVLLLREVRYNAQANKPTVLLLKANYRDAGATSRISRITTAYQTNFVRVRKSPWSFDFHYVCDRSGSDAYFAKYSLYRVLPPGRGATLVAQGEYPPPSGDLAFDGKQVISMHGTGRFFFVIDTVSCAWDLKAPSR